MFKDYKIAVTGGTSGIGLESVKKFLEEGATVIAIGRNLTEVKKLGEKCIPYQCDVSDPAQLDACCEFIDKTFGGELDTFVNAAGLAFPATIRNITTEIFDNGVALLLRAPILFGKNLYPLLAKSSKKNGSIVNVASSSGWGVSPENCLYNLCKVGHVQITRQQAAGFSGVRSNAVCPGWVDTPIFTREGTGVTEAMLPAIYENACKKTPMGRVSKPEEIAELVAFLASEDAMYINGANVLIDGGLLAWVSG